MAAPPPAFLRVRLACLVMIVMGSAFVVGVFSVLSVLYVTMAVDICLSAKGSVLYDDECRTSIHYSVLIAVGSVILFLMLVVLCRESKAQTVAQIGEAAGGAPDTLAHLQQQERRRLSDSDGPQATKTIINVVVFSAVIVLLGAIIHGLGFRLLLEYPADNKWAVELLRIGTLSKRLGTLTLSVGNCFLIVPYVLLQMKRVLGGNVGVPARRTHHLSSGMCYPVVHLCLSISDVHYC